MTRTDLIWHGIGIFGQCMFFSRFLVQWLSSERAKKVVIPVAFWYLSMFGGLITLCYAIQRQEPVFMAGQAIGIFVYTRNLILHHRGGAAMAGADDSVAP